MPDGKNPRYMPERGAELGMDTAAYLGGWQTHTDNNDWANLGSLEAFLYGLTDTPPAGGIAPYYPIGMGGGWGVPTSGWFGTPVSAAIPPPTILPPTTPTAPGEISPETLAWMKELVALAEQEEAPTLEELIRGKGRYEEQKLPGAGYYDEQGNPHFPGLEGLKFGQGALTGIHSAKDFEDTGFWQPTGKYAGRPLTPTFTLSPDYQKVGSEGYAKGTQTTEYVNTPIMDYGDFSKTQIAKMAAEGGISKETWDVTPPGGGQTIAQAIKEFGQSGYGQRRAAEWYAPQARLKGLEQGEILKSLLALSDKDPEAAALYKSIQDKMAKSPIASQRGGIYTSPEWSPELALNEYLETLPEYQQAVSKIEAQRMYEYPEIYGAYLKQRASGRKTEQYFTTPGGSFKKAEPMGWSEWLGLPETQTNIALNRRQPTTARFNPPTKWLLY